ncbi:MAG TPA: signal peptidase II [Kofleriaceae bacterium]|nr:signal peptidase II [Kofleriaceae bacterium]
MALARRWRWFLAIGAIAILADQLTKLWARHALVPGQRVALVDGYWDWRLSFNPGASFNLFESATGARIFLSVVGVAALGVIGWMVKRASDAQRLHVIGLGLIAGGAAGNLVDRIANGVVTDFALWHWGERAFWPMFNVADAALVLGVAILLVSGSAKSRVVAAPALQR